MQGDCVQPAIVTAGSSAACTRQTPNPQCFLSTHRADPGNSTLSLDAKRHADPYDYHSWRLGLPDQREANTISCRGQTKIGSNPASSKAPRRANGQYHRNIR